MTSLDPARVRSRRRCACRAHRDPHPRTRRADGHRDRPV